MFRSLVLFSALIIAACTPQPDFTVVSEGKVRAINASRLLIEEKYHVSTLNLESADRSVFKTVKPGQKITLLGRKIKSKDDDGEREEIQFIKLENGTLIPLGS